jgi:NAD(P)-dependent dehydrogenase (short-subunit alcohol dehydrogenase family)
MKKALIIGVTSEIGVGVKRHLEEDGWQVFGTSSSDFSNERAQLDLSDPMQVKSFSNKVSPYRDWSLLCFFAGTMEPISPFFDTDFGSWERNFRINALSQIEILQMLWPYRSKVEELNICFLAGGGTNSSFDNYSAYCLSKIILIKFVELIASENKDEKFFIIGPGFINTKIHEQTIKAGKKSGTNLDKTKSFMEKPGTSISRLYEHIKWCIAQPKEAISGRNFSTVHDPWDSNNELSSLLSQNPNVFKLRRLGFDNEAL